MAASTLLLGAMAAGTTMSVAGQLNAGKAAEQQGKDEQTIANYNSKISLQNAEAARVRSAEEAKIQGEEGRRFLARQKAGFAAGNVLMNVGSPLVVEAETQANITRDIGFTIEQGRVESAGYRSQSDIEIMTGKLAAKKGKAARVQSLWGAAGTGLSGYGTMAYKGYENGTWGSSKTGNFGKTKTLKNQGTTNYFA